MSKAETPVLAGSPVKEFTLGDGFPGFEPIPVVSLDENTKVTRHTLSDEEAAEIARTRQLYVLHPNGDPNGATRFHPVRVVAEAPEYTLRCLRLKLSGRQGGMSHGLEVSDAGGTEAERVDYVVAEGAALLAASAQLPARVALLKAKMTWVETGGELCSAREQLEAALTLRLKKALDDGTQHVEVRCGPLYDTSLRADVVELSPRQIVEAEVSSVPG